MCDSFDRLHPWTPSTQFIGRKEREIEEVVAEGRTAGSQGRTEDAHRLYAREEVLRKEEQQLRKAQQQLREAKQQLRLEQLEKELNALKTSGKQEALIPPTYQYRAQPG